jgi:uncharacterized protein YqgV (UPF0045/DUF77 family)
MAIVAVSISPVGEGVSVGSYVAEALRVLRAQDRVVHLRDKVRSVEEALASPEEE